MPPSCEGVGVHELYARFRSAWRRRPRSSPRQARVPKTPLSRSQADRLEAENADLAGRERSAVLELYALETRLARADRRAQALQAAAAEVERDRAEAERRLDFVRANLASAEVNLADRLRLLYVEESPTRSKSSSALRSLDER